MTGALDFELLVGPPSGQNVPLRVLDAPAGEAATTATFPFDTLALESRLKDLQLALVSSGTRHRRLVPEQEQAVQAFGAALFDFLFSGEVRSLLDRSREEALRQGKDLRIQLRFETGDMASLPWEFMFDQRRGEFVCLSSATPVIRYVEMAEPQQPLTVTPPLRLLAMAASPNDLPALDVDQEHDRIRTGLAPLIESGRVELHWLEGQTWRHLQSTLLRGPWHAFHFIGHGGFDQNRREGIVALTDDDGGTCRMCATDLGRLLGDHRPLRLAVLNSCDGARADRLDVFSSTASVLVRRGTPAVVAMQYEITDDAAVELSRTFYSALAEGVAVDVALGEARKAVALSIRGSFEWGTPVLYLRAPDSRIFHVDRAALPLPRPPAPPPPAPPPSGAGSGGPGPDAPTPPWWSRRKPVVGVAAGVVIALVLVGLLLMREPSSKGMGESDLELAGRRFYVRHTIEVPPNSIVKVEVEPGETLDADVAVATELPTARRLEDYLQPAGFDLDEFEEAFFDLEGDVRVNGRYIGRVDEGAIGEAERIVVVAPFGGRFTVVVAATNGTRGSFHLSVGRDKFKARARGDEYIEELVTKFSDEDFLSDEALADLEAFGGINLGGEYEEELDEEDGLELPAQEPVTTLPDGLLEEFRNDLEELFPDAGGDRAGDPESKPPPSTEPARP